MATANDVAAAILDRQASMTAMKLQKLAYYAQGVHLAFHGRALFSEAFEAWADGPVCRQLYRQHRGRYTVAAPWQEGSSARLTLEEVETVDRTMAIYGALSGDALSRLSHAEPPWREPRGKLGPRQWSNQAISVAAMEGYFTSIRDELAFRLLTRRMAGDPRVDEAIADQAEAERTGRPATGITLEDFRAQLDERLARHGG